MLIKIANKIGLLLLVFILTGCSKSEYAPASIAVFGDSLSDQGNLFAIASHATHLKNIHMSSPPSSHNGHALTNKLLAVEYLAKHYEIELSPAWDYKKSNAITQVSGYKGKESHTNIFTINALNTKFQATDKNSSAYKEVESLIENLLTKIHLPTLTGNNYAIANTTIASHYSGLIDRLFNQLSLPHQIAKYKEYSYKEDIEKTLFVVMIGGNDIINIARASTEDKKAAISNLIPIMVKSIQELQALGAKKILVIGVPDIGKVPAFYKTSLGQITSELSEHFNQELGNNIAKYFSEKQVKWLPISEWFSNLVQQWPPQLRHKACISDIANGYFEPIKLLEREELSTKFVNNCTQQLLNDGNYVYYDSIHGTDAVYQKLGELLIQTTSKFLSQ